MLFLLEFTVVLYGRSVKLYYTRGKFFLVPWAFQAILLYSYYPLWNHFEPPYAISFVVTKWRIMSQSWTLNVICLISLGFRYIIILTWNGLKVSLRLLFGTSKILSLGVGVPVELIYQKEKKSRVKNIKNFGLLKKNCIFMLKKITSSTLVPILTDARKEG